MAERTDVENQVLYLRSRIRREGDVLSEARRILKKDLLAGKNILDHLAHYEKLSGVIDEEDISPELIFRTEEIKALAIAFRLKFLNKEYYKPELPCAVTLKTEALNKTYMKDLNRFKVLSTHESFKRNSSEAMAVLFVETNYENYYLVHGWGRKLKWYRKLASLPLRNFESLVTTVVLITLILAVTIPTRLITLDHKAAYWSGYRAAAFFHLLIFNSGVTVYFTFAFARNFSSSVWDRYKDFG